MPSRSEYMRMADKADAAGDTDAARDLYALAQSAQQNTQPTGPSEVKALVNDTVDAAPGFASEVAESVGDFGRGFSTGVNNIARDVIKTGLWAAGEGDQLSAFNETTKRYNEGQAQYKERSPWAFGAGDIVGEGAALLPVGGLTGLATKSVIKGVAGEGFLSGAITSDEDTLRGKVSDGAVGAGVNVVGGKILDGAMDTAGTLWRASDPITNMTNWLKPNSLRTQTQGDRAAEDVRERIKLEVNPRVEAAADYGGYDLNGNTALATRQSLREVKSILAKDDSTADKLVNAVERQEADVTAQATKFVDQFGADLPAASEAGELLATTMSSVRSGELDVVVKSYNRLDKLAKTQKYVLPGKDRLATNVESMNVPIAAKQIGSEIRDIFNKYNIRAGVTTVDQTSDVLKKAAAKSGPQQELTYGTYNELRKELNAFYGKPLNSGEKDVIHQAKKLLDTFIEDSMHGLKGTGGDSTVRAARVATARFKDFSETWDDREIITRVANSADGKYGDLDFSMVVQKLTARSNTKGLEAIKAKLLTSKDGDNVWASLQAAPLLDALEKATADTSRNVAERGQLVFNHKAFEAAIKKSVSPKAQETLWKGSKYDADFINKAVSSWKMRDRVALTDYRENPSGSALALLAQLKFLPSGIGGRVARTGAGISEYVVDKAYGQGARDKATDLMLGGEVSEAVRERMTHEALAAFEETYRGGAMRQYSQLLSDIINKGIIFDSSEGEVDKP